MQPKRKQMFDIKVGHLRLTVEGESRDEALRLAREQLCTQMPRLWDVITTMSDDRFEISPLQR